tara:strand:- start:7879 stop:8163 length:285 start_codon:yes stop_codon:yes gene_type:complete
MENPENLSPEELKAKKEEMLKFYKESMPYLEAQFEYEKMLSEIDEMRLKRTQIQMAYAQMMAPPEDFEQEQGAPMPEPVQTAAKKKRTLKKETA